MTKAACFFEKSSSPLSPVPHRRNAEGDVCQRTRAQAIYSALLSSVRNTERRQGPVHRLVESPKSERDRQKLEKANDKERSECSNLINVLNQWVSHKMASFCSGTFLCSTAAHHLHSLSRSARSLQLRCSVSAIPEANLRTLQKASVVTKANRLGAQFQGCHRGGSGGKCVISRYHGDFLRH